MATTFAVRDICMHPEYVEPLRKEIEGPAYQAWEATGNCLPLLDNFLTKSARINPLDNLSTRRMVLKPFTMSNGVHVERGDWLATPLTPMLQDPKNWTDPLDFHGFRHLDAVTLAFLEDPGLFMSPEPEKAAPLTDTRGWQTWGTRRMACSGRFYTSAGIKQIFQFDSHQVRLRDHGQVFAAQVQLANLQRSSIRHADRASIKGYCGIDVCVGGHVWQLKVLINIVFRDC
ncbi:hypothetical protein K469DRAFT_708775 [Zopfia rhizophila CBS 207.26]|uniref:Cytochrome P450 n=1 Tax=Zopfia rhizophila CBS 207.26 TaxID=1314779 RepID=A0A6A6E369_9PEZI|nr:hypothetical protein K469DRAFT_708775 [Zopfia rhizophila CBS 207.26]